MASEDDLEDAVYTTADEETEKKAKNKNKKTGGKVVKNKAVKSFIVAHILPITLISLAIILVIWLIGVFAFFTTIPGMILEKVKGFGKTLWGAFSGFFTGDSITSSITEGDVIELAQYIQSMGYEDLESCGFGDVEYEEDGEVITTNKQIKKINDSVDGKNYLKAYISANESTWALSTWSVFGALKEVGATLKAAIKVGNDPPPSNESYSTGMINILKRNDDDNSVDRIVINRQQEKMVIYEKSFDLGILGAVTNALGLTSNGAITWGETFSYDMSSWTARYGRPTELFLSIHLSTMMPDLAYRIATDPEINTKVNIVLQEILVRFTELKAEKEGANTLSSYKDVEMLFLTECVKPDANGFYEAMLNGIKNTTDADAKQTMIDTLVSALASELDAKQHQSGNVLVDMKKLISDYPALSNLFKSVTGQDISEAPYYAVGIYTDGERTSAGYTHYEVIQLAMLTAKIVTKGNSKTLWPYIQSVTKHWFYNDIDFTKGVYRRAAIATKKMKYNPPGQNLDMNVKLNAELTAGEEGLVYQVCEPETSGPNEAITKIFQDEYYKYDGTALTAKAIDNAKRWEANGGKTGTYKGVKVETPTVERQKVSFEANKTNPLTAFSILENMHSEAGEFVYRNLKELMVKLDFLKEEDIREVLKDVLVWLIKTDDEEPDTDPGTSTPGSGLPGTSLPGTDPPGSDPQSGLGDEVKVTRDPDKYGIFVEGVKGKTVIAPGDCKVETSGETTKLTFGPLNENMVKLLNYIYNGIKKDDQDNSNKIRYKEIDKNVINGVVMLIKGVNTTSTGNLQVGAPIGEANGDLHIVMLDRDQSVMGGDSEGTPRIEDVEDYMKPEHNDVYYKAKWNAFNKVYGDGIDIGWIDGDGIDRSNSQGNEPQGNEPQGNEPQGNEPQGNEPQGNEPQGNEPQGNEPQGNEPQGNEPQGNEPQGNEPQTPEGVMLTGHCGLTSSQLAQLFSEMAKTDGSRKNLFVSCREFVHFILLRG